MTMSEPVYLLRDVRKVRSKSGTTFVLHIPELILFRGAFVSVVGPSGCGKSTLLDLLALVLAPSSAHEFFIYVRTEGKNTGYSVPTLSDHQAAALRRGGIGYILQNGGLLPFLTVRENILLSRSLSGSQTSIQEFSQLIAVLGLEDQLAKKPQYLSGGQRQRVAIARALVHNPAIVLADEPTAAVDRTTAEDIRDELCLLARERGAAVVMVSHDRALVSPVSDMQVQFTLERHAPQYIEATACCITKPVKHSEPSCGQR